MSGQFQYGQAVAHSTRDRVATTVVDEPCHFKVPARFGRRKTDQVGTLVLTDSQLAFHGRTDLSLSWSEVARVACEGREVIVSLDWTPHVLRFWCHSPEDAAEASAAGTRLASLARSEEYQPA